ncbi:hypothetical protein GUJ93_ZPchr0009g2454 [Zizania palustris]|uniref:BURP domain-containing protein n=1 Tax=Zizania palustris TaxID=103762 RepID=A0A8J5S2L7_ZIZPA|nr:hypothetical protein GUJ93_ZPchr0009g2454 [Zizania palustris]
MACCLLALAVIAMALTAQSGQLMMISASRTSPAEAFWRAALPGAAMPDAILELLHRENDVPSDGGPPPAPPMNFNYDDYRASPRSAAATSPDALNLGAPGQKAAAVVVVDDDVSSPPTTVFFLEDALRVGESLPLPRPATAAASAALPPLRLYTVRSVRAVEGSSFVLCRQGAAAASYGCRATATGPARAYAVDAADKHGNAVSAAAVCHTDTSRWDPDHAAFRLLGVKPGGATAVCRAVPNAQILSVSATRP